MKRCPSCGEDMTTQIDDNGDEVLVRIAPFCDYEEPVRGDDE